MMRMEAIGVPVCICDVTMDGRDLVNQLQTMLRG